ncbi:DgyrCDS9175 [Dimorphilus gyrociliatus]|uniref:DgyrCDS9175 n=1 Tax=Dimorphilus gyrociliatus TaxID=2664684 RepID=A0A7I8VY09_9ANNE|nr:DgyrCDS9175 [Dimorphilus gyrociliatus]
MKSSKWLKFVSPSSIGSITAAMLALYPAGSERVQWTEAIALKLCYIMGGFLVSYFSVKALMWTRKRLLISLFSYTGWMIQPKSLKAKIWAIMIKVLRGPRPFKTFSFQNLIPKQPLPELNATLDKWLKVSRQFVTEEEFLQTEKHVEHFRKNQGPKLHAYLIEKAKKSDSWLNDYWLQGAYLASRKPLAVYSNYFVSNHLTKDRVDSGLPRAANIVHHLLQMNEDIKNELIEPVLLQDLVPLCMSGYKTLFGTCRIPGLHMDSISMSKESQHIVVLRRGHYYKLQVKVNGLILSPGELKNQLQKIRKDADGREPCRENFASLTCDNRSSWANNREYVKKTNEKLLNTIETSLFHIVLDDTIHEDISARSRDLTLGKGWDRWFDVGFTAVFYEDGSMGCNVEHSTLDAMVFANVIEYVMIREQYCLLDIAQVGSLRNLPDAERLEWNTDEKLTDMLKISTENYEKLNDRLDLIVQSAPFGKGIMKKCRLSPDGFIQMALQLAFYKKRQEIAKTYEPATGRLFLLGRTDTVHPVSEYSKKWVECMTNKDHTDSEEKRTLLSKAVKNQTQFRLDATMGNGCDRHLFALYCASRELGMDPPMIFPDSAWMKDFKLSTSQTPTIIYSLMKGKGSIFEDGIGGFGPQCDDGYGISYVIYGENLS